MNCRPSTVAFLGFPRTGKSTYLGALWQLVQDPAEPSIVERDVTGDRSYLQKLGDQVARGEEIGRTATSSVEGMQLTLGFDQGDIRVHIPDLGGETLRMLVEDRIWDSRLQETIAASDSMLLFLHPEKLDLPFTIAMADEILSGLESSSSEDAPKAAKDQDCAHGTEIELPKFRAQSACTIAKCIDALENILMCQRARWPIRLGVIISAWDTVEGSPTPASWIRDRLPALDSFSRANTDMIEWSLYGVSAQGGTLPDQRDELLARGSVRDRVYAQNANGVAVPVTDPLRWAVWK